MSDDVGMLVHVDEAKRREALGLVRQGGMYDLGRVLDERVPVFPGRYFRQTLVTTAHHGNGGGVGSNRVNWITEVVSGTQQLGAHLDAQAAYHRVAVDDEGHIAAFLLAFREGADYDSPNYLWFAQRYPRFLYVDRIAVAQSQHGRGIGARLYRDLFGFARTHGVGTIACEFYRKPLNAASQAFHARFGFREVGTQWLPDVRKQVSLQVATA